mmetsp:Transcript_88758/g.255988  ORF Transcript_88758/g.255988 Transcript_88758/m.255988 type:complete len:345 (-) Transcript_88758:515-1549(-)
MSCMMDKHFSPPITLLIFPSPRTTHFWSLFSLQKSSHNSWPAVRSWVLFQGSAKISMHFDWLLMFEPVLMMKPRGSWTHSPVVEIPLSSHFVTLRCVPDSLPGVPSTSMHRSEYLFLMNPISVNCHLSTYLLYIFVGSSLQSPSIASGKWTAPQRIFSTTQRPLNLFRSWSPTNSHWCHVPGEPRSHSPRYKLLPSPGARPSSEASTFMQRPLSLLTSSDSSVKCHTWSVNGHSKSFILSSMHLPDLRFLKKPSGVWSHRWSLSAWPNSQGHCETGLSATVSLPSMHMPLSSLTMKPSSVNLHVWSLAKSEPGSSHSYMMTGVRYLVAMVPCTSMHRPLPLFFR